MSVIEKSKIISLVASSGLPRRRALAQLGLAKSTYYRWLRRQSGGNLQDRKGGSPIPWNKLRPKEEEKIFVLARALRRGSPDPATRDRISLFSITLTRAYLPFIPEPALPFF